jgi:hypothetical protein
VCSPAAYRTGAKISKKKKSSWGKIELLGGEVKEKRNKAVLPGSQYSTSTVLYLEVGFFFLEWLKITPKQKR